MENISVVRTVLMGGEEISYSQLFAYNGETTRKCCSWKIAREKLSCVKIFLKEI